MILKSLGVGQTAGGRRTRVRFQVQKHYKFQRLTAHAAHPDMIISDQKHPPNFIATHCGEERGREGEREREREREREIQQRSNIRHVHVFLCFFCLALFGLRCGVAPFEGRYLHSLKGLEGLVERLGGGNIINMQYSINIYEHVL